MNLEQYYEAKGIVARIEYLDDEIEKIKNLLGKKSLARWDMMVAADQYSGCQVISHYGLLPEFLKAALNKHVKERDKLIEKLTKI